MLPLWSAVLFAVALSVDGFGVGITYGLRRIKIPWSSLLVICFCSGAAITLSMIFGSFLAGRFSVGLAKISGSLILILVGAGLFIQGLLNRSTDPAPNLMRGAEAQAVPGPLLEFSIRPLGIAIQIYREPHRADLDQSGTINTAEALLLGAALALDAFTAGFGAALAGFPILVVVPAVIAVQYLFVSAGGLLAGALANVWQQYRVSFLPGLVLILIGIIRLNG